MEASKWILKSEERAILSLRRLFSSYGYRPYKMNRFEEYDLYVRNKDFLVSDQVITFADRSGKLLALKPDVTLSIIKNSPDAPGVVQKLYYNENVYRSDSGHTIREIPQTGLECVGDLGSYEIAEVTLLAAKSLALLGENFVLDISHMGFVAAVMESCGVAAEDRKRILQCLHQKNGHELEQLCTELDPRAKEKLFSLLTVGGPVAAVKAAMQPMLTTQEELDAFGELCEIGSILEDCGFADKVRVDFSVANNMKYYSGIVFKGYLEGIPASILSGGQYDRLAQRMGRKSRAIGFALYLDMLERHQNVGNSDVDTLILCDASVPAAVRIKAAEEAAKNGSVLVAESLPVDRNWKNIIDLTRGGNGK